jgi:hypothetical protein
MAVSDYSTNGGNGNTFISAVGQQEAAAQAQQTQQSSLQNYANLAIGDLNSGNYAGALQEGLDSSTLYNTNYSSATTDPLLQALESSQGLQELDPSKQWNAQSIQQYYAAFGANPVTQGKQAGTADAGQSLGKNPYGLWGDPSKVASDAQTNINTQGDNSAPDIERFAGAKPTTSFLGKYGTDIAALAATALSFGVAAPALAGALAADGIASGLAAGAIAGGVVGAGNAAAIDAITGKPVTLGSVAGGALGGAAGGGLTGLAGGAINNATGLGNTISTGIAGAGIGAARGALTGGNVGLGALTGGIGGAVQGSGVAGQLKGGLSSATGLPSNVAGGVVNGGLNYAIGGVTGAAAGALMGGGSQQGGASQGSSIFSQGAQGTNGNMPTSANSGLMGSNIQSTVNPSVYSPTGSTAGSVNPSTDSSLASTITGALPGVLQGAAGVYGAQNAAQAQTSADANAINTQQSTLGNINNIWSTQQNLGQGAQTALGSALGTNGQPANYSGFENMPGYQFAVQQGTQAIQRQAAAMGNAYTPNTAAAVGQYVTGTASQDYNTYIQQLMGAAGLGSTANQGIATPTYQTGANISTLQQNQGQAQASGVQGSANAIGGLLGGSAGSSLIGAGANALGLNGGNSSGNIAAYGTDQTSQLSANGSPLQNSAINASAPTFDFSGVGGLGNNTSNLGNIDTSNFDYGFGDGS